MAKRSKTHILFLDDERHLLELYKEHLEQDGRTSVVIATDGTRAREIACRQLFDIVVIDAKLPYRGEQFGGLQLADDLRGRYGKHSIIVVSQFITENVLRNHEADYDFLDKETGGDLPGFISNLQRKIKKLKSQQFAFVAMPFAKEYQDLYARRIKTGVEKAGLLCYRADDFSHTQAVHSVLFRLVRDSKLVVFVADGANPNAYYEAGFADAMQKEVVIVAKSLNDLCFDVSNRLTLAYGEKPSSLPQALSQKIDSLRSTGTNL